MRDSYYFVKNSAAYNVDYHHFIDTNDYKETNKENANYKRKRREPPSRAIQALGDAIDASTVRH